MPNLLTMMQAFRVALQPDADRYNTDPASDVMSMREYQHMLFLVMEGAGGTGTAVLTVEECSDAAGSNPVAIPFRYRVAGDDDQWGAVTNAAAAGYTTVAGANKMIAIEVDAAELSDGKPFVRLQITEAVDAAVDAAVLAIGSRARYAEGTMPTMLS